VFVSGCFDLLHGGHIEFLTQAKALGQKLVVCVPTDEVIQRHKQRPAAMPLDHRMDVLKSLSMVDEVVVGDDPDAGLNFKTKFGEIKPAILAVTEDDKFEAGKRKLCKRFGAEYVKLPKTLKYEPVSTTDLRNSLKAPEYVPVRVDFGGGWLDVPRFARPDSFVVNCAVTPMVSLKNWGYERNGGLGGSAAYNVLMGNNAVNTELELGVGWQDPAVITETGLCSWVSGPRPVLDMKTSGDWLAGMMALAWTGKPHNTPSLVSNSRNWDMIAEAGKVCRNAVRSGSFMTLVTGINLSYTVQRQEGMDELPSVGEIAKKYCGGGFGGYALYLFTNSTNRESFVAAGSGRIAIEPFIRQPGS
jgi:cytidyltransferase-like protein